LSVDSDATAEDFSQRATVLGFSTDRSKIGSCRGASRRDSGRSSGEEIVGTAGCENQSKPEGEIR
ncbi:hypothetical protein U1Q18_043369, partial [Sarracenia purpurea var. burkii]